MRKLFTFRETAWIGLFAAEVPLHDEGMPDDDTPPIRLSGDAQMLVLLLLPPASETEACVV